LAVSEIANTSKHFVLRNKRTYAPTAIKTKRVTHKKSNFVDFYEDDIGNYRIEENIKNDISITLSDGSRYALYAFLSQVTEYWKNEIKALGIKVTNSRK
jgi:hypothetical protein